MSLQLCLHLIARLALLAFFARRAPGTIRARDADLAVLPLSAPVPLRPCPAVGAGVARAARWALLSLLSTLPRLAVRTGQANAVVALLPAATTFTVDAGGALLALRALIALRPFRPFTAKIPSLTFKALNPSFTCRPTRTRRTLVTDPTLGAGLSNLPRLSSFARLATRTELGIGEGITGLTLHARHPTGATLPILANVTTGTLDALHASVSLGACLPGDASGALVASCATLARVSLLAHEAGSASETTLTLGALVASGTPGASTPAVTFRATLALDSEFAQGAFLADLAALPVHSNRSLGATQADLTLGAKRPLRTKIALGTLIASVASATTVTRATEGAGVAHVTLLARPTRGPLRANGTGVALRSSVPQGACVALHADGTGRATCTRPRRTFVAFRPFDTLGALSTGVTAAMRTTTARQARITLVAHDALLATTTITAFFALLALETLRAAWTSNTALSLHTAVPTIANSTLRCVNTLLAIRTGGASRATGAKGTDITSGPLGPSVASGAGLTHRPDGALHAVGSTETDGPSRANSSSWAASARSTDLTLDATQTHRAIVTRGSSISVLPVGTDAAGNARQALDTDLAILALVTLGSLRTARAHQTGGTTHSAITLWATPALRTNEPSCALVAGRALFAFVAVGSNGTSTASVASISCRALGTLDTIAPTHTNGARVSLRTCRAVWPLIAMLANLALVADRTLRPAVTIVP